MDRGLPSLAVGPAAQSERPRPLARWSAGTQHPAPQGARVPPCPRPRLQASPLLLPAGPAPVPPPRALSRRSPHGLQDPRAPGLRRTAGAAGRSRSGSRSRPAGGPCPGLRLRLRRASRPGDEERRRAQGQQRLGAPGLAAPRPRAPRGFRHAPGLAAVRRWPDPSAGLGRWPRAAAPPVCVEQVEEEDGLVHVGGHRAEASV